MKRVLCVIFAMVISAALVYFSPRFGWCFGKNALHIDNVYFFKSSTHETDKIIDTYSNRSGQDLMIEYENRFSRDISLIHADTNTEINIHINMDTGLQGNSSNANSALSFILNNIIVSDSSGMFFAIYLRSIAVAAVAVLLAFNTKRNMQKRSKKLNVTFAVLTAAAFIWLLLLSARVV